MRESYGVKVVSSQLHLDACSMNLVETAYEVRSRTQVLISSQYLGWNFFAYDKYAELIDGETTAKELGRGIVEIYSDLAEESRKPYTISAVDMQRSSVALNALDALADELAQRLIQNEIDEGLLLEIRADVQTFDSGGNYQNDPSDLYIDLRHWASLLRKQFDDSLLDEKAAALVRELDRFIPANESASGRFQGSDIGLEDASGISIFYPDNFNYVIYQRYIDNELFKFAKYSHWTDFLESFTKSLGPDTLMIPEPMPLGHLDSAAPLETATPVPTATELPTDVPTETPTVAPTITPTVTDMPVPTSTPLDSPMPTATPTVEVDDGVAGTTEKKYLYLPIVEQ